MKEVRICKAIILGVAVLIIGSLIYGLNYDAAAGIPVLNYHKVENNVSNPLALSAQDFAEQMEYLYKNGYTTISPDQLLDHLQKNTPLPAKPVLITFDDGYQDNYIAAYPIMKKYGFTATIFLISDRIGHDDWYMNWDQIQEMRLSGFVFGSHTLSHVSLSEISREEALFQLVNSREGIEWKLDVPVKYFAYPSGDYNAEVEKIVQHAGYKAAFAVKFGRVEKTSDVYSLDRIPIFKSKFPFPDFYLRLNFTSIVGGVKTMKDAISAK